MDRNRLWLRWILANGLGEMVGLGLTFVITGLFFARQSGTQTAGGILLSLAVAVASGSVEATLVGLVQWGAMHPWFPSVSRFAWWRGTLLGALIAYVLGYLPSTLMDLGNASTQAPAGATAEPPQWVTLLLAAGLGVVGGAVLSFAQGLALRGKARRAGMWIPANMLAWLLGMPLIFWGIDLAFKLPALWQSVLLMAGILLMAGVIVGTVHGWFLMKMVPEESPA
jgi:hypothetical protein